MPETAKANCRLNSFWFLASQIKECITTIMYLLTKNNKTFLVSPVWRQSIHIVDDLIKESGGSYGCTKKTDHLWVSRNGSMLFSAPLSLVPKFVEKSFRNMVVYGYDAMSQESIDTIILHFGRRGRNNV